MLVTCSNVSVCNSWKQLRILILKLITHAFILLTLNPNPMSNDYDKFEDKGRTGLIGLVVVIIILLIYGLFP